MFRVFASNSLQDTHIGKVKKEGGTIEKFANSPDHCFIYNDDVNNLQVMSAVDKQWYIDLAHKHIGAFLNAAQ